MNAIRVSERFPTPKSTVYNSSLATPDNHLAYRDGLPPTNIHTPLIVLTHIQSEPRPSQQWLRARHERWIVAVLILNLCDLVLTGYYIEIGWAVEANPLAAYAYEISPLFFAVSKLALTSLSLAVLHRFYFRPFATIAVQSTAVIYGVIMVHHAMNFPIGQRIFSVLQ